MAFLSAVDLAGKQGDPPIPAERLRDVMMVQTPDPPKGSPSDSTVHALLTREGNVLQMDSRITSLPLSSVDLGDEVVISTLTGGMHFFLAQSQDGRLFAWGTGHHFSDYWGQLGRGSTASDPTVPAEIESLRTRGMRVVGSACGADHALCLFEDGKLFGWGSSALGELGTRDRLVKSQNFSPVQIFDGVAEVLPGGEFSGSTAVRDASGRILVSGLNNFCQLGFGSPDRIHEFTPLRLPELVSSGDIVKFSRSYRASALLTRSRKLLTSGKYPDNGRTFDTSSFEELELPPEDSVLDTASGKYHTIILSSWGPRILAMGVLGSDNRTAGFPDEIPGSAVGRGGISVVALETLKIPWDSFAGAFGRSGEGESGENAASSIVEAGDFPLQLSTGCRFRVTLVPRTNLPKPPVIPKSLSQGELLNLVIDEPIRNEIRRRFRRIEAFAAREESLAEMFVEAATLFKPKSVEKSVLTALGSELVKRLEDEAEIETRKKAQWTESSKGGIGQIKLEETVTTNLGIAIELVGERTRAARSRAMEQLERIDEKLRTALENLEANLSLLASMGSRSVLLRVADVEDGKSFDSLMSFLGVTLRFKRLGMVGLDVVGSSGFATETSIFREVVFRIVKGSLCPDDSIYAFAHHLLTGNGTPGEVLVHEPAEGLVTVRLALDRVGVWLLEVGRGAGRVFLRFDTDYSQDISNSDTFPESGSSGEYPRLD